MALISAILWSYTTAFEMLLLQREANKHYNFFYNLLAIMVKHRLFITYNCILQLQKQRQKAYRMNRALQQGCAEVFGHMGLLICAYKYNIQTT